MRRLYFPFGENTKKKSYFSLEILLMRVPLAEEHKIVEKKSMFLYPQKTVIHPLQL